jgi:4-hydroxymandelate synthase
MTRENDNALLDVSVDHVRIYVSDTREAADQWHRLYGLRPYAVSNAEQSQERSIALGQGDIRLIVTQALVEDHPATSYVALHGEGVADIALRTPDATRAYETAVERGARPVSPPTTCDGVVTAAIIGFGDVVHTFIERSTEDGRMPGFHAVAHARTDGPELYTMDHFAVCLEEGQLGPTVRFYHDVLGFEMIFRERIIVGGQAMESQVVRSHSGKVTLTLLEPDTSRNAGQIDEFIKNHGGAGVQHVAFATNNIVATVDHLRRRGVEFLGIPVAYYDALLDRLEPGQHTLDDLRRLDLLVDEDHEGQLFQIFTRSTHPRRTLFFEIIERAGATTFGSGNIKALYAAVEQERDT